MEVSQLSLWIVVTLVLVALAFDFMNGFHDAANSIATVVSTGVMKPHHAVAFAAFFNFVAIFIFHLKVASTVGKGIVDASVIDHYVIFGALVGAISWNGITWFFGLPSSSSHALIGGMVGAGFAKVGFDVFTTKTMITLRKTAVFIIYSPLVGLLLSFSLIVIVMPIFVAWDTSSKKTALPISLAFWPALR